MATFPGSYVLINASSNARVNYIVDNMVTPRILEFRQISVYDEMATRVGTATWKLTYGNWNEAFTLVANYNSEPTTPASIDYTLGTVTFTNPAADGDTVHVTYNIDWFTIGILAGFIYQSVDVINNSGQAQAPTTYTIDNAPDNWNGVIADLVVALCMEKLILDYDLWKGRLIFAIGANQLEEGGGDIIGQLETIKTNAEERAKISLDNEKFKIGNLLAPPTSIYYAAVRGIGAGGLCRGRTGRLRGIQFNRYI